jgi:hypothetical protein
LEGDEAESRESRSLEERVERFTGEIAGLINGARPELRKDLRDLAIGLLRERVDEAEAGAPLATVGVATAPFSPLAVAIPLLLVGCMLLFLFPPVGLVILMFAGVMLVWGLIASLFFRRAR